MEAPERGLVSRGINLVMRGLEFSSPPALTSREGEGLEGGSTANGQGFHHLCNEASIKAQEDRVLRASWLMNTWRFGERG